LTLNCISFTHFYQYKKNFLLSNTFLSSSFLSSLSFLKVNNLQYLKLPIFPKPQLLFRREAPNRKPINTKDCHHQHHQLPTLPFSSSFFKVQTSPENSIRSRTPYSFLSLRLPSIFFVLHLQRIYFSRLKIYLNTLSSKHQLSRMRLR